MAIKHFLILGKISAPPRRLYFLCIRESLVFNFPKRQKRRLGLSLSKHRATNINVSVNLWHAKKYAAKSYLGSCNCGWAKSATQGKNQLVCKISFTKTYRAPPLNGLLLSSSQLGTEISSQPRSSRQENGVSHIVSSPKQ